MNVKEKIEEIKRIADTITSFEERIDTLDMASAPIILGLGLMIDDMKNDIMKELITRLEQNEKVSAE